MTQWYQNRNTAMCLVFCCRRYSKSSSRHLRIRTGSKNNRTAHLFKNPQEFSRRQHLSSGSLPLFRSIDANKEGRERQTLPTKAIELMRICNAEPTEANQSAFRDYIVAKAKLVTDEEECKEIVNELLVTTRSRSSGTRGVEGQGAQAFPVVSIDLEGVNLGQSGRITLLQLYDHRENLFIFDILTAPKLVLILQELLISPNFLKIIHDCRSDVGNLYSEFGIELKNIFDTQAAYNTINVKGDITLGRHNHISLTTLCQQYGVPSNPFKHIITKKMYLQNQAFWIARPLTHDMIAYAASDVLTLPILYSSLTAEMESDSNVNMKKIFEDECQHRISSAIQKFHKNSNLKAMKEKLINQPIS